MRDRLRDERGAAVTVWTILIATALTMIVGLAVDLSGRVNTQRLAGDVAAQAARTAGQQLDADVYTSTGGDVEVAAARAKAAAIAYAKASGMTATARIESGHRPGRRGERRLRAGVPVRDRDRHPTRHCHRPRPGRQSPRREGTLMLTRLRGLLALLGLAAIVIGVPALLIAAAPIGAVSVTWTPEGIWRALSTPDNGTIALALFKLVGWIAWAILTVAVLLETVGLLRRTPVPHLPGFAVPQLFARRLVASAAVLFIATSSVTTSGLQSAPVAQAAGAPRAPVPAHALPAHGQPAEARGQAGRPHTYTVKKGDTLSEIALEQTGRASNYPKLFRASTHTVQPGGRHLTDPDEIDIGWKITIPSEHAKHPKPARQPTEEPAAKQATSTPAPPPAPAPSPQSSVPASSQQPTIAGTEEPAPTTTAPQADATAPDSETPAWVLSGLAGAGALLAGGLLLALTRRRAAQFRNRRPGRMIATPPPDTIPVEKTLIREGRPTGALVLFIDEVLRRTTTALTTGEGAGARPGRRRRPPRPPHRTVRRPHRPPGGLGMPRRRRPPDLADRRRRRPRTGRAARRRRCAAVAPTGHPRP